jgi:hypothetical protein
MRLTCPRSFNETKRASSPHSLSPVWACASSLGKRLLFTLRQLYAKYERHSERLLT